jgi:hypothetical protein
MSDLSWKQNRWVLLVWIGGLVVVFVGGPWWLQLILANVIGLGRL